MSDRSMYVEDEVMGHWPYLPKFNRVAKFSVPTHEYMDKFFLALDAKSQESPVLAWKGSAERIYGRWRP
jgi:hypothetical protein